MASPAAWWLGLCWGRVRSDWMPCLPAPLSAPLIFEPLVGSSLGEIIGYALIEVRRDRRRGLVAARLSAHPLAFRLRDVAGSSPGRRTGAHGAVLVRLVGLLHGTARRLEVPRLARIKFAAILLLAPFIAGVGAVASQSAGHPDLLSIVGGVLPVCCSCFASMRCRAPAGRDPGWVAGGLHLPFARALRPRRAAVGCARRALAVAGRGDDRDQLQTVRASAPSSAADEPFATPSSRTAATRLRCPMAGLLLATIVRTSAAWAGEVQHQV